MGGATASSLAMGCKGGVQDDGRAGLDEGEAMLPLLTGADERERSDEGRVASVGEVRGEVTEKDAGGMYGVPPRSEARREWVEEADERIAEEPPIGRGLAWKKARRLSALAPVASAA